MVDSIKNVLGDRLKKAGIYDQVDAAVVCNAFNDMVPDILGKAMADKAKAMYVKKRTLHVASLSSVVVSELKMREAEILKKLEQKVGKGKVEKLRFVQ